MLKKAPAREPFCYIIVAMFIVEITKSFQASQGLNSPVRASKGLSSLVPKEGFAVVIRAGIEFSNDQLNERGWFVDTDAVEDAVAECAAFLGSDKWTSLFDFRPTFELVSKWSFDKLNADIVQLRYIELENKTIGVRTRYTVQK